MINIIAAISKNRVIANNGKIPWHIPNDLKYFKKLTSGKHNAVLMGFNTWKSLPTFPDPLPNRGNFVITKNNAHLTRAMVYKNPDDIDFQNELFTTYYPNVWICGGQSIYEYYIDKSYIDKIYLTEIDINVDGDRFFPELPEHFSLEKRGEKKTFKLNALTFASYEYNVYKNNYKS